MNNNQNKIWNELSPKEKIKINFRENSLLYKIYLWLFQKNKSGGTTNENDFNNFE